VVETFRKNQRKLNDSRDQNHLTAKVGLSRGTIDRRRTQIRATLVPGGTIGPVPQIKTS
jgi:hypothetical protein